MEIYGDGNIIEKHFVGSELKEIKRIKDANILLIGCDKNKENKFEGCIDEIRYYNTAITMEEARGIYLQDNSKNAGDKRVLFLKN